MILRLLYSEYTVSYGTNMKDGVGTIVFTGTGEDADGDGLSYIGTKTVTFKINGTPMSKVSVSGVDKNYSYTGTAINPIAKLTCQTDRKTVELIQNVHYTVNIQKNIDTGTATMIFTGIESMGYTGTKKQTFKIIPGDINGNINGKPVIVTFADSTKVKNNVCIVTYAKGGAMPEIMVTCDGYTLKPGMDYTVSYTNNKKVELSTTDKASTIIVKGKGNYTGQISIRFTITSKPLTNENGISVLAKDKIVSTKANGYRQSFKVYDEDGKALGSSDYDAKNVTYTLPETVEPDGTVKVLNQVLDKNSVVPANSVIQITVEGKGVYVGGKATGTYLVLEKDCDISKAMIQINPQSYTGKPVFITSQEQFTEGKVYIKIGKDKVELVFCRDFEVVPGSYVKNVN